MKGSGKGKGKKLCGGNNEGGCGGDFGERNAKEKNGKGWWTSHKDGSWREGMRFEDWKNFKLDCHNQEWQKVLEEDKIRGSEKEEEGGWLMISHLRYSRY